MLKIAHKLSQLQFGKLMEIYLESNLDSGRRLWPDLPEGQRLLFAEQDFYQYLHDCFFREPGSMYVIWQVGDRYLSALRLERFADGILITALETHPDFRGRGYGRRLLQGALEHLGEARVYSHVKKDNRASLRVHEACGFQILQEYAVYLDGTRREDSYTLCFSGIK